MPVGTIVSAAITVFSWVCSLVKTSDPKCAWDAATDDQKEAWVYACMDESFEQKAISQKLGENYRHLVVREYFWEMMKHFFEGTSTLEKFVEHGGDNWIKNTIAGNEKKFGCKWDAAPDKWFLKNDANGKAVFSAVRPTSSGSGNASGGAGTVGTSASGVLQNNKSSVSAGFLSTKNLIPLVLLVGVGIYMITKK